MSLESNHPFGELEFQLKLYFGSSSTPRLSAPTMAIEPDVEYDLGWVEGRWESVTAVGLSSLHGPEIRHWECDESRDYRLTLKCHVESVTEAPDLTSVEEATLWVFIADSGGWVAAYVRLDREWDGYPGVSVRFRDYGGVVNFCPRSSSSLRVGVVERMACGGGVNSPLVTHSNVASVKLRAARCQRHESSGAERSVWACEPW